MIQSLNSSSLVDSPAILQLVRYFAISHACFRNSNAFLSLDTFCRSAGLSSSIIKSGSCESPDRTPCAKFDTGYSLKSHLFKYTKKINIRIGKFQNNKRVTTLALPSLTLLQLQKVEHASGWSDTMYMHIFQSSNKSGILLL